MDARCVATEFCVALVALAAVAPAVAGPWQPPEEGSCAHVTRGAAGEDAGPLGFAQGDVVPLEEVAKLEPYLPPEVWEHRDRFFFAGMRLEIGACHRDYAPPDFFREATEEFRGQARLDGKGRLKDYTAGLPFPPDAISAHDPEAGMKWAWNAVHRYQGAGSFGRVRMSWVAHNETKGVVEGEYFVVRVAGRADRADNGHRADLGRDDWMSAGWSRNPDGRRCAWRQNPTSGRSDIYWAHADYGVTRRPSEMEGPIKGCVTYGSGLVLHGAAPQLHRWRVLGTRDVLAPINSLGPLYPDDAERNFGPWGISFAGDRWELRRALVLEGIPEKQFEDRTSRFVWYLDLQTLFPLYYIAERDDGDPAGIGYYVGRWSEDRADYPPWPDDPQRPVRNLDAVGAAFVDWGQREAVRVESGDAVATPPPDKEIRRRTSKSGLLRMAR